MADPKQMSLDKEIRKADNIIHGVLCKLAKAMHNNSVTTLSKEQIEVVYHSLDHKNSYTYKGIFK